MRVSLLFCFLVLISSCKTDRSDSTLNKFDKVKAILEKIGEIKLMETKGKLIGNILFFRHDYYKNNYLIADVIFNDLKVINIDGYIENIIGKQGKGPGEFGRVIRLTYDEKFYYLADDLLNRISIFSKDTGYVYSFKLPKDICLNGWSMEVYNNEIYVSTWQLNYKPYYEVHKVKPISVFNLEGQYKYSFGDYDDIYRKKKIYNSGVLFDIDKDGFIYLVNARAWKIFKYDKSRNFLNSFGNKGLNFFEQKESVTGNENYDQIIKLSLKTSAVKEFYVSDFIYFQYTNNTEEFIKTRSRIDQHHYLMVYTKDGEYIKSDIKLPGGGMLDVDDNGIIYIELSDEPGNRIIGKYKLKIIDEN